MNLINQIKQLNKYFWLYNFLQVLERIGTWILIIELPIYISQKGIVGGLEFEQYQKGIIYFFWAFSQNFTSIFVGSLADKYGKRKVMKLALMIIIVSLISLSFQHNFYLFTINLAVLGISSGFFKPALQGRIAQSLNKENSSIGWGIYVWLINLSIFVIGTPLAKYLKEISWQWIFLGSALVFIVNFISLMVIKDEDELSLNIESPALYLKRICKGIFAPKVLLFVLPVAGFTLIYMQFYEILPNYIYDWVPTNDVISYFNISQSFITNDIIFGNRLSYEWIYGINTGVIIFLLIPMAFIFAKMNKIISIIIGLIILTIGFAICGYQANGFFLVVGIFIYTIGEMITNPKLTEYIASIAPIKEKSQYLGYLSIAWTIGLSFGGLLGGYLYGELGEREALAKQQLSAYNIKQDIKLSAFEQYAHKVNNSQQVSIKDVNILYMESNPYKFYYIFIILGFVSAIGLIYYWKRYYYNN